MHPIPLLHASCLRGLLYASMRLELGVLLLIIDIHCYFRLKLRIGCMFVFSWWIEPLHMANRQTQ